MGRMAKGLASLAVVAIVAFAGASAVAAVPVVTPEVAAPVVPPTIKAYGDAPRLRPTNLVRKSQTVAIAGDPSSKGYWSVTAAGRVVTHGPAKHFGSAAKFPMPGEAVDIVGTSTGNGYWIVSSIGGVYNFGDAAWLGSLSNKRPKLKVVAMARTPSGNGYYLTTKAGRVFPFGDAPYLGRARTIFTPPNVVDIAVSPTGAGYTLLDSSGSFYVFGDAMRPRRHKKTSTPARAFAQTTTGRGYWVLGRDGNVVEYGDATELGRANEVPKLGLDIAASRQGYWAATTSPFPAVPADSGSGYRVVYSNSMQRIWLIEATGGVHNSFLVSGRTGAPPAGTYFIASKSENSTSGSLRLPYMSRFFHASSGKWIGFHGIPLRSDGTPIQTDAQLGTPRSHGCVRMNQQDVKVVWDFTPVGTKIVVVP